LNADVLSAAIDLLSSPPYADTGVTFRTGKRATYMRRHASRIAGTATVATISVPVCARASNPQ